MRTPVKKIYRAGPEWGPALDWTVCVIICALYGLKTSANAWRQALCLTLNKKMGFEFSLADNDVWFKRCSRPDGTEYYSYILIYTDNILIVSHSPSFYMTQIQQAYYVKKESIGPPTQYLGQQIKKVNDRSGRPAWASSSNTYVNEAVRVIEAQMKILDLSFTKTVKSAKSPFSSNKYNPELNISDFCSPTEHQFFQKMISILRWTIEGFRWGFIPIQIPSPISSWTHDPGNAHILLPQE